MLQKPLGRHPSLHTSSKGNPYTDEVYQIEQTMELKDSKASPNSQLFCCVKEPSVRMPFYSSVRAEVMASIRIS